MDCISRREADTEAVGERLARAAGPGTVIALRGGLGMGKTALVRGLARGLGYAGRVTSPTFTIVNEYEGGRLPLFHFDLYRLPDAGALYDLDWDGYLERGGVCAVEWSERAEEAMPPETVWVTIARDEPLSPPDRPGSSSDDTGNSSAGDAAGHDGVRRITIEGVDLP